MNNEQILTIIEQSLEARDMVTFIMQEKLNIQLTVNDSCTEMPRTKAGVFVSVPDLPDDHKATP